MASLNPINTIDKYSSWNYFSTGGNSMSHWKLVDEKTGKDLFWDNESYTIAEIVERSGISRRTLERKRLSCILWVKASKLSMSRGDWIKYALRNDKPRPMPKGILKSIIMNVELKP